MEYIKISFTNIEPIRIADDKTSQMGQTDSLSYIPGSSIRGAVIGELIREGKGEDQAYMNQFLSDKVRFLNAYPVWVSADKKIPLLPALKGFYESKEDTKNQKKAIENVLQCGKVTPGHKKASMGSFGYVDGECFHFGNVEKMNDLRINIGRGTDKRNIFRNQCLCPGYTFAAYVQAKDAELVEELLSVLQKMKEDGSLILGNARSQGLGRCVIKEVERSALPYEDYAMDEGAEGSVYMLLLSDMTMRDELGENVGIDIEVLKKKTGLRDLRIEACATNMVGICGYNRQWGARVPSAVMYDKGSIFRFTFTGCLSKEKLFEIENEGLGMRKNEGFGRVLFLKNFEAICCKQEIAEGLRQKRDDGAQERSEEECSTLSEDIGVLKKKLSEEECDVLKIAARGIYFQKATQATESYLAEPPAWKGTVNRSQLGNVRAILSRYRYSPEEAKEKLKAYLSHQEEKEEKQSAHREGNSVKELDGTVSEILDQRLEQTLCMKDGELEKYDIFGFCAEELFREKEREQMKLELLIRRIDAENRRGKANG